MADHFSALTSFRPQWYLTQMEDFFAEIHLNILMLTMWFPDHFIFGHYCRKQGYLKTNKTLSYPDLKFLPISLAAQIIHSHGSYEQCL